MKITIQAAIALLFAAMTASAAAPAEPFAVGEKWTYVHEGAIPMRPPDERIEGDRTKEVVSAGEVDGKKFWRVREKWGEGDTRAATQRVGAERMCARIEFGQGDLTIDPARPVDFMHLGPGGEETLEVTYSFGGGQFSFPMKMTAKRVEDETLTVPAGEFENCAHVTIEETVTFSPPGGEVMEITTKREHWYHPDANGAVKESFILEQPGGGTAEGTSVLKSYAKGGAETE